MVYGGRPSRGCQTCRQRRIKCDERKPSCVQCEKSNRVCQGYRDVLDLLFKSENEGVERRVGRNSPEQIYYVLPQEPEQLALNYFFKHYIFIPRKSEAARGYLEVLPVLYADVAPTSSLLSATSALAFTVFARDAFGKQFLPNARLKYGEAIHRINEALGDPVAVRKDETLMAVLIMGMVEMSTSATTLFWNTHTDGAAAIIKLRGREIFARETSMRLFHHTRIQMALRRVQVPPGTLERMDADDFMETLESDIPPDFERSVTNTLTKLTLRVPKIRMLTDNLLREKRSESTTQAILQLIECCRHLDTALLTWCETTPEDWKYTSQPNFISVRGEFDPETSEFYPVNVDIYPDIWIAKAWNSYRTSRTVVQAIILRAVAWLAGGDIQDSRVISQMAVALQARQIVQEMVDEICASVPFNLGYATTASKERASTVADKSYSQVPKGQEDPTEHLGGYFILWPLYLAGSAHIIPNEQKRWINVRLLSIARSLALDEEVVTTKLHEPPGQVLFGAPLTYTPYNIA